MKVIIYSSDICPDCVETKDRIAKANMDDLRCLFIDITENTGNLKRFLKLRDTLDLFDTVRRDHIIGIPLFQFEDGTYLLDKEEAFRKMGII
ncbi:MULTISPECIES: hypothetical protein [Sellimonas]|uniref:hypothetical protein n=1 Tax=Sellimonas TaxID=1769710 RepID=UPI00194F5012|nr:MULTISPECIES: hypothetical protein [Sellimonas]